MKRIVCLANIGLATETHLLEGVICSRPSVIGTYQEQFCQLSKSSGYTLGPEIKLSLVFEPFASSISAA